MAPPTMRRLTFLLLATFGMLLLPIPSASAQEPGAVRLTLLSQTPWNSTSERTLTVRFRAENLGEAPIGDLSIGLSLYGRVITRTAYEGSLVADTGFVIDAETFAREGTLEPGLARDFEVTISLDSPGIDPGNSGVYPLKLELRSGFTSLATLRSPVVFLVRQPEQPLALSWMFVLDHPIAFRPDGVFTSTTLEEALAPGGRLEAQIRALLEIATGPSRPAVDVAVSPVLLLQLERMRGGYEVLVDGVVTQVLPGEGGTSLAEQAIADLTTIADASNVRVAALPFSSPELPALLSGGLGRDLGVQLDLGRRVVGDTLQTVPATGILRPPGAVVDEASLGELAGRGISTVVVGPSTVEAPPQPLGFAGPPVAAVGEDGSVDAIVPEPAVATLLQEGLVDEDPVRAAQVVLGEIAAIWQERPGQPRGIAVVLSEDAALPAAFFVPFARAISGAPWVEPMHASVLAATFPATEPSEVAPSIPRSFGATYVEELRQARRRIATYRSTLVDGTDVPDRLDTMLLLAQSRQFLSNPTSGLTFIRHARDTVGAVFDAVALDVISEITLTSSSGSGIPITVTNGSDDTLRLTVRLVSQNLRDEERSELVLAPGLSETVRFDVELKTTGRFLVQVQVLSPGGRTIVEPQTIVVRSTAYNRIALIITSAAALVLLALWARRFLPRRTT